MRQPFEVSPEELAADIDAFVNAAFVDIQSTFLFVPKGPSFLEYPRFREGYEALKRATVAFHDFTPDSVWDAMREDAMAFVVVRTILGFKPGELAQLARKEMKTDVNEGQARGLDKDCRTRRDFVERLIGRANANEERLRRLRAMVEVAVRYVEAGAPDPEAKSIHRLNKMDTANGLPSLQSAVDNDVPYPMLLYERPPRVPVWHPAQLRVAPRGRCHGKRRRPEAQGCGRQLPARSEARSRARPRARPRLSYPRRDSADDNHRS